MRLQYLMQANLPTVPTSNYFPVFPYFTVHSKPVKLFAHKTTNILNNVANIFNFICPHLMQFFFFFFFVDDCVSLKFNMWPRFWSFSVSEDWQYDRILRRLRLLMIDCLTLLLTFQCQKIDSMIEFLGVYDFSWLIVWRCC